MAYVPHDPRTCPTCIRLALEDAAMSAYPFVSAAAQFGTRKGPVKAFVVHMAEGGGTVGFLSRPNPRNVSVHYVVEYSGRIVQMVRESEASGSINPNDLRTTDDILIYGATPRKAVMGEWDRDPNSAVISCEIEGFAAAGPNAAQHGSLRTLVDDVRSRYPTMGLLGHRDFQDYKACPGKLIHWDDLGGHGETNMGLLLTYPPGAIVSGLLTIPKDANSFRVRDGAKYKAIQDAKRPAVVVDLRDHPAAGQGYLVDLNGDEAHFVLSTSVPPGSFVPTPSADCSDAVAAEHERTRTAAIKAVEAIA